MKRVGKIAAITGLFAAFIFTIINSTSVSALMPEIDTYTSGVFTDANDVRWEWKIATSKMSFEQLFVSIGFFDKPESMSQIVIPSFETVKQNVPDFPSSLDTYYLDAPTTNTYGLTKRGTSVDITKLDFTNAAKIQIVSVVPMLNYEIEAEIVFGDDIVIAEKLDPAISWMCPEPYCEGPVEGYFGLDWNASSDFFAPGAFEGYKLKVTGLDKVKYYGWSAFANVTFNEANREVTIDDRHTYGARVFAGSNIKKATITANGSFEAMFAFTSDLESVIFGDEYTYLNPMMFYGSSLTSVNFNKVEEIGFQAFAGASIESLDLTNTVVKIVGPRSFADGSLKTVKLDNGLVEKLDWECFRNNQITEIYFPKSLRDLNTSNILAQNPLEKVTVAFDTMISGTTEASFAGFLDHSRMGGCPDSESSSGAVCSVKELVILAPYEENEEVRDDRLSIDEYIEQIFGRYSSRYPIEVIFENLWPRSGEIRQLFREIEHQELSKYKNVISPSYFYGFRPETITIGEGMEFIGSEAFFNPGDALWGSGSDLNYVFPTDGEAYSRTRINNIVLPESLKGIGSGAFSYMSSTDFNINLPEGLEYIGALAFRNSFYMKNDINLPELRFIGDNAFGTTGVHDVYLGDKLDYVGRAAFEGCWNLHDITIDFDAFANSALIPMEKKLVTHTYEATYLDYRGTVDYGPLFNSTFGIATDSGMRRYMADFGMDVVDQTFLAKTCTLDEYGYFPWIWDDEIKGNRRCVEGEKYYEGNLQKFGTITFTENVRTDGDMYFYTLYADKLDLGKSGITEFLDDRGFTGSNIGELILPEGLKRLGNNAFASVNIDTPLILPESLEEIGKNAFNRWEALDPNYVNTAENCHVACSVPKLKIQNLPQSLKKIDTAAFMAADIDVDIDLPNLTYIGGIAFTHTNVHNIHLYNLDTFGAQAFTKTLNLNDIILESNPLAAKDDPDYPAYKAQFVTMFADFYDFSAPRYLDRYGSVYAKTLGNIVLKGVWHNSLTSPFLYGLRAKSLDVSELDWKTIGSTGIGAAILDELILPNTLEELSAAALIDTKVTKPVILPASLKRISGNAFQWADIKLENDLPESLTMIGGSAFFGTQVRDELTIPASVETVGYSAFNAGDRDVHYSKITIKPDLSYAQTSGLHVFQTFWNADIDELVIDSNTLPALASGREDYVPEFWGMTMQKVTLNNIPTITQYAFESCDNLVEVDLSANTNLTEIREYAFADDNKLAKVTFADGIEDNTVDLGLMSFAGTALKDISGPDSSFDLTAAKFNADKAVFANINTLVNVSVPNNFTNGTIPELTFFNDPELRSAEIDYKIEEIGNKAFTNDNKLLRLIIWGKDTNVVDEAIDTSDMDEETAEIVSSNPTIPQTTDIYAYSVSIAEDLYAEDEAREGNFYALDEVMQLSSNNVRPMLNDDETDFDKTDVILYALRRDGVILESTELYNFSDAYKRTDQSGKGGFGADGNDDAALRATYASMILDTPVPMDEVDLSNQNFEEVTFDIESSDLIRIYYEDWYSGAIRETTLTPYSEDIEVPKTGFMNAVSTTAKIALPVCPIILVVYFVLKKKSAKKTN